MFSLSIYHFIQAIMMIGVRVRGDCRVGLQDGWFGIKFILLAGLIVASFFIPNQVFEVYGWIALIGSGVFILVQLVLLVDFAHSWAESWIGKHEELDGESNVWWYALLGATIVMYLFSAGLTIFMYIAFCEDAAKCQENVGFITINLIAIFVISAMSIHPKVQEANPKSGILQSSLIGAYSTYLIFSSIMSNPEKDCNPYTKTTATSNISLLIGAAFTIVAVCYSTVRAVHTFSKNDIESDPLIKDSEDKEEEKDKEEEEEILKKDSSEPVAYNFTYFHLLFTLGSLYVTMLMSDWFTVDKSGRDYVSVDTGLAAVWVKAVSSWIGIGLYIWTLFGPVCLPDREWGYK